MRNFLFLAALISFSAQAADSILSEYQLDSPDVGTLLAVSKFFDVERHQGQTFELTVPQEQASLLLALAPNAKLTVKDTAAAAQARLRSFDFQSFMSEARYHSLAEVQSWMRSIAFSYPAIAKVIEYGKSAQGKSLLALRLTKDESVHKPVLMITAATHGDELITTEVLMELINKLISGYGNDERLSQMINRHDLYFVPVLNVDGFAQTRRFDGPNDPNRSYPYPENPDALPTPSIAGIIKLFETIKPVGSIDFHAYGEMIMYPWAYTLDPVPEPARQKFNTMTAAMAQTNKYVYGPISKVIYVAKGSSADYYFWKNGSLSLGIEMGQNKIPNPSEFPRYVQSQTESTWRFIESF